MNMPALPDREVIDINVPLDEEWDDWPELPSRLPSTPPPPSPTRPQKPVLDEEVEGNCLSPCYVCPRSAPRLFL